MTYVFRKLRIQRNNMNDITSDFASLKVSALSKASLISNDVKDRTIGPDSVLYFNNCDDICNEDIENEPNNRIVVDNKPRSKSSAPKISTRNGITFSIKKILLENKNQQREEVRKTNQRRLQEMEKEQIALEKQMNLLYEMKIAEREQQKRLEENAIAKLEAEEEQFARQTEIKRKHEQRLHEQRISERKEKLEREAEEQRRKNVEKILVDRMVHLRTSFESTCQDISSVSKSCKDRNVVSSAPITDSAKLRELRKCMEGLFEHAKMGNLTEADIHLAESLVKQGEDILNDFRLEIEKINIAYDAEIARREEEVRRAQAQEQIAPPIVQAAAIQREQLPLSEQPQSENQAERITSGESSAAVVTTEVRANPSQQSTESVTQNSRPDSLYEFFDNESLQNYLNSRQLFAEQSNICAPLIQSDSMKKFRVECQKAINIPVNAISGVSREHLIDKYEKLHRLLDGKPPVQANKHPQGIGFCKLTLAKKFVNQGEALVSSKPEMAFSVAAVAIALWKDFPDFGQLLLANFYETCPYLVPIFLPQQQGQSNEDYYRSLGYKYSEDGTIERQDKFLKRMSGLMRLYVALTVTKQRQGTTSPHPYGLNNAWRWLAATLNIEPRPDVCATLIFDMLEVAGNALWKTYPTQFPKLLAFLISQYFPRMQNIGGAGGGPMARLEEFLKSCLTKGSIPPPDGQLPPNFW